MPISAARSRSGPPGRSARGAAIFHRTNILETEFTAAGGVVRVVDFMPALTEAQKRTYPVAFREIVRRVRCIEGSVVLDVRIEARPQFGRRTPLVRRQRATRYVIEWGSRALHLVSNALLDKADGTLVGRFSLRRRGATGLRPLVLARGAGRSAGARRPRPDPAVDRGVLDRLGRRLPQRGRLRRCRAAERPRPQAAHLRAVRRDHRRADQLAPGARWAASATGTTASAGSATPRFTTPRDAPARLPRRGPRVRPWLLHATASASPS